MVPYSSTGSRDFFAADLFVLTFDPAELIECRVDTYSTVVIKQNHYLVPEEHVGKYIKAKVGAETIHLFLDGSDKGRRKKGKKKKSQPFIKVGKQME
ncbi:hypothetical protein ACFPTR_14185, partial [Aliibacillus thermotolerans]